MLTKGQEYFKGTRTSLAASTKWILYQFTLTVTAFVSHTDVPQYFEAQKLGWLPTSRKR